MPLSLVNLRHSFIPLLAKAIRDLFPKAKFLGAGLTDYGFYCDFLSDGLSVDADVLTSISDRINELVREGVEIKQVQMLLDNLTAFLRHHRFHDQAALLEEGYSPGLLNGLKLGNIFYPVEQEIELPSINLLKHFRLMGFEEQEGVFRFNGTAFLTSKELKSFVKRKKGYSSVNHQLLMQQMLLYTEASPIERGVWLPKGKLLIDLLLEQWRSWCKNLAAQDLLLSCSDEKGVFEAVETVYRSLHQKEVVFSTVVECKSSFEEEVSMGLWRQSYYFSERLYFFCGGEEAKERLISSLQFILETAKMLGSDSYWLICSPGFESSVKRKGNRGTVEKLEQALQACDQQYHHESSSKEECDEVRAYLVYEDGLGKAWKGPFVSLQTCQTTAVVSSSLFGSFERAVAYLLERYKGELPLFLAPEQVRVLAMAKEVVYAREIAQEIEKEGYRVTLDVSDEKLAQKILTAETERIPCILVVGEKEKKQQVVTARRVGSNKKERVLKRNLLLDELSRAE